MFGLGWRRFFESHPFTIASPDGGGTEGVQCVVKRSGDWTTDLYGLAAGYEGGLTVRCTVEGPYGESYLFYDLCWSFVKEI